MRRRRLHSFARAIYVTVAMLAFLSVGAPLAAQTLNPNVVEFLPPALANDVSRYDIAFYQSTALDPFLVVSAGKPAPQADGLIRVDLKSMLTTWPAPNVVDVVRVVAVWPSGPALSAASNTFSYTTTTCGFALSSTSSAFAVGGGTGSVGLTTQTSCAWQATSNVSWISVFPRSGTGSATINYSVAANKKSSSRSGTLTVAGLAYTVTQAGSSPAAQSPTTTTSNQPPTVKLVKPSTGDTFNSPAIRIDAEASDVDGTVALVTFYANGVRIGDSQNSQWSIRWSPPAPGAYTLTAVATDNAGATATSAPVSITVR